MHDLQPPRGMRLAFVLASLAIVGAASAALSTKEYDFSVSPTQTTFTSNVSLNQFDPSLGTLLSVTFGFQNTMATTIRLSNDSTSSANSLTGTVNGSFSFNGADGTPYLASTLVAQAGTGIGSQGIFAVKPSANATLFQAPYGGVFGVTSVDANYATKTLSASSTSLTSFIGLGSLNYLYSATGLGTTTGPNGSSPANYTALYQTNASAKGYVIYNYQPVPEPSTIAALGLGALGILRRRKGGRK